jgi:hypothetical protein
MRGRVTDGTSMMLLLYASSGFKECRERFVGCREPPAVFRRILEVVY